MLSRAVTGGHTIPVAQTVLIHLENTVLHVEKTLFLSDLWVILYTLKQPPKSGLRPFNAGSNRASEAQPSKPNRQEARLTH